MKFFNIFKKEQPVKEKRSLVAAIKTRFTDWIHATLNPINLDLVNDQLGVISKCRDASKNNPIVRSYLSMAQKNIIGKSGLVFQSQLKSSENELNEPFNNALEWAWYEWGKAANNFLTIDGGMRTCRA